MEKENKKPRLRPHESISETHKPYNRFIKPYEQKLGQLSLTDGVPVIHEAPPEVTLKDPDNPELGWALNPDYNKLH